MEYSALLKVIENSQVEDWNVTTCWGANSGPSFLNSFSVWTSGTDRWGLDIGSHLIRAAYKPDVSIGIAYGLDFMDRADLEFDWAKSFPDERVTGSWADVLWNGMLVHRQLMLVVDGGRAILPAPSTVFAPVSPGHDPLGLGEIVTPFEKAFARIVHGLESRPEEFDRYFQRAGLLVEPGE